jgi:O-acetyl-ADP-ribose deacetylase (regulator of RNase III)
MTNLSRSYRGVEIVAITGDITEQKVDAIINPANSWLVMGGGVAGAIKRIGGEEIEEEAVKHAPIPVGKAVATGAGKLRAKYLIHAPTMERPAMRIAIENVRLAVKAALECADELKLKSVAFPGMGTGVGGLALEEAAKAMIDETRKHVEKGTHLKRIVFVGFTQDLTQAFSKAINNAFAVA